MTLAQDQRQRSVQASERTTVLGEMASGIVHDIRNVLAIVSSGLNLAESNVEKPEKVRSFLAGAREGVERGLKITSQLLDSATPHSFELHAEDVNDIIKKLASFLKYGAGSGIRIVFDLADDIPTCLIDPLQFDAAILNLVANARDAMPDGGEIVISTKALKVETSAGGLRGPARYLRVRVKDNGHGMTADTLRKIFDPYFTTKGETGTGLGVPQVCAFMRSVDGYVRVSSEPGVGTCFDLLFPAHDRSRAAAADLWRELDRWVNEGGTPGDDAGSVPHKAIADIDLPKP